MGYAVVMVDGRGSANRGIDFEAPVKYALVNYFLKLLKTLIYFFYLGFSGITRSNRRIT